ncbi:MAG: Uncharacterized protein XD82_1618 [Methanoculleus marisnigri]|uniref:Uncharacterized protein n=1 Tax=Methanoculleus marisnigri TaxID=2198 RepID=A0A117LPJ0_9EURY|nr:MAG: Uncharacterized protein XD82_1618 [Methanoculleus marisnigri]
MIPERCTFCKGTLQEGKTEFMARVGDEIIVIRDRVRPGGSVAFGPGTPSSSRSRPDSQRSAFFFCV